MEENFNEYLDFFRNQTFGEKQNIVFEHLQILSEFTSGICKELDIPNEEFSNNMQDLNKENLTNDDFAEKLIILINSIQNSICNYSNRVSDLLDNSVDEDS